MRIVEEREAWIYTHFIVDSFFITESERRQISTRVEPELIQISIVRKAFGVGGWCLNISLRRAENDVVIFLISVVRKAFGYSRAVKTPRHHRFGVHSV